MDDAKCGPGEAVCDISDLFRLLGKTHMMEIIHVVLHHDGPARFGDIQRALNLSPNTLSARLKEFVDAGLLERTAYNEIPPRVDYTATAKAYDLRHVFRALGEWARTHDLRAQQKAGERLDEAVSSPV